MRVLLLWKQQSKEIYNGQLKQVHKIYLLSWRNSKISFCESIQWK